MSKDKIKREVLPIPDKPYMGLTTYTAKDPDTKFPKFEPLRPPEGAPNVLVILLDDVGFGASSAFGGPVNTPTAERLAGEGLKYTRFHSTAVRTNPPGPADRAQPPLGGYGHDHGSCHPSAGL